MIDVTPLQTGQTGHTRYGPYPSNDFIHPIPNALDFLTPSGMPPPLYDQGWAVPPCNWVNLSPTEGELPILPFQGNQPPFLGQASHQLPSTYKEALKSPSYPMPGRLFNDQESSDQIVEKLWATFCKWSPNANGKLGETGFGNSGCPSTLNAGSPLSLCTQLPSPPLCVIRSLNPLSPPPVSFPQIPLPRYTANGYGEGEANDPMN